MATVKVQKYHGKNRASYIVRYKDPLTGRSKHYKTFHRLRDANLAAHELRQLIDTGKLPKVQELQKKRELLTFGQVADSLIEVWRDRLERDDLRPDTVIGYQTMTLVLKRHFERWLMVQMTEDVIRKHHLDLHRKQSPASANRYLFVLKQLCKHAVELGVLAEDPSAALRYLSERKHERNKFILPHQIDELVEISREIRRGRYMPALIYLGAEHGTSRQEALSLEWAHINFDYDGQGLIRFYRTKNGHERSEYLMPRTRQALLEWREYLEWMRHRKRTRVIETRRVFCWLNGRPIKSFKNAWRQVVGRAGLDDFHYHDLRHTFCSNLLLAGADLKDVKEMIGHSDISMTDRYAHLTMAHKRLRQRQLAHHYSSNISG